MSNLIATQIRLTPELYEALRKLSYETKTSHNEIIRQALTEHLVKEKPGK